jgi:hypothetical protein
MTIPRPAPAHVEAVLIRDLAETMGRSMTGLRYMVKCRGVRAFYVRGGANGQACLAVSPDDARTLIDGDIKAAKIISPADLMKG